MIVVVAQHFYGVLFHESVWIWLICYVLPSHPSKGFSFCFQGSPATTAEKIMNEVDCICAKGLKLPFFPCSREPPENPALRVSHCKDSRILY